MSENQRPQAPSSLESTIEALSQGTVTPEGRLPYASNGTFLVSIYHRDMTIRAVYKPEAGERPLWDFPSGLARREVAAYEVDIALAIGAIPPTILREDLPFGRGSLQHFVEADFRQHYFTFFEDTTLEDSLVLIAALDIVANNTDRKSGHLLLDEERKVWAIDNGLCFHTQPKLRTVIWDFCRRELPEELVQNLYSLSNSVSDRISSLLEPDEIEMLQKRSKWLADLRELPYVAPEHRSYPWPVV